MTSVCHAEQSASIHQFVMLSEAKHPRTGFLTAFGMTKKSVRNDQ